MIRISSSSYFQAVLPGLNEQRRSIARLTEQLANNTRLVAPSDDVFAFSRATSLTETVAVRTQYLANQTRAQMALNQSNTVLTQMDKNLTLVRNLVSGSIGNDDPIMRTSYGQNMASLREQLLSLGNYRDPDGNYIFSGYQTDVMPFQAVANGAPPPAELVNYMGDANVREIEVENGRRIQVSDPGSEMFPDISLPGNSFDGMNIFEMMDTLSDALINNTATSTQLTDAIPFVDEALKTLRLVEIRVGDATDELDNLKGTTQALLNGDVSALESLTAVDQAAVIIELQSRQTTLEASQTAFSRASQLSLFNYL